MGVYLSEGGDYDWRAAWLCRTRVRVRRYPVCSYPGVSEVLTISSSIYNHYCTCFTVADLRDYSPFNGIVYPNDTIAFIIGEVFNRKSHVRSSVLLMCSSWFGGVCSCLVPSGVCIVFNLNSQLPAIVQVSADSPEALGKFYSYPLLLPVPSLPRTALTTNGQCFPSMCWCFHNAFKRYPLFLTPLALTSYSAERRTAL